MILGKRTLRFGNRVREDTVFVCMRRFMRDDHEYQRGDIVPKDVENLKRLWNIDKIHMRFVLPDNERELDPVVDEPPVADETHPDLVETPEPPEPVSQGGPWFRIEGVEGAFRGADAAIAAWKAQHGG